VDENDPRPTDDLVTDAARGDDAATTDESAAVESEADESAPDDAASEEAPGAEVSAAGFAGRHPVLVYTLLRLGILVAVAGVLYLLGARGLILLVFAFLVSGLISMVALKRPREGAAYGITTTVRKVNDRIDAAARAEDDDDIDELMDEVTPDRQSPTPPPTS
jgi:hypothetical protein